MSLKYIQLVFLKKGQNRTSNCAVLLEYSKISDYANGMHRYFHSSRLLFLKVLKSLWHNPILP